MREFYNEDCMAVMARYPDKYFDLCIADPPYGIQQDGRTNHTRGVIAKAKDYRSKSKYDNEPPTIEYFVELQRVSKHQIIWGANHFLHLIPHASSSCWIVWDKENGENDFADCELAYTSFDTAVRRFKWRWQGMLQGDMKNKQQRIHPNEKPYALYRWLLQNYAKPGDILLDTHVGSASSLIAFEDMGFSYVGCEIDTEYYQAASKRLEQFRAQPKLDFAPTIQPQRQTSLF